MNYNPEERTISQLERDLIYFASEAEKKGSEWARSKSLFEQLEDLKKVTLADNTPDKGTIAEREKEGLRSDAYRQHLEDLSDARFEMNKAYVHYQAAKDKFECVRTIVSNRREQLKRGIE